MKKFLEYLQESVSDLPFAESIEHGYHFETGKPVTFPYLHNTEKSPYMGQRFQQDIEPNGTYCVFNELSDDDPMPGWEKGEMTLKNPLVLLWNTKAAGGYDENSWKAILVQKYNRKGKALTSSLKKDGYDGVVTIDPKTNKTLEIVKLA